MSQLPEVKSKANIGAETFNQSQRFINAMQRAFSIDIHTHTHLH